MGKIREFYYKKVLFPIARKFDGGGLDEYRRGMAVSDEHEKNHVAGGPAAYPNCHHCRLRLASTDGSATDPIWAVYDVKEEAARRLVRLNEKTGEPEADQPELANFLLNG